MAKIAILAGEPSGDLIASQLMAFIKNKDKTKLLFISYDLKNKIEKLNSRNDDKIKFPVIRCVVPEKIFSKKKFVNLNKLENKSIKFFFVQGGVDDFTK